VATNSQILAGEKVNPVSLQRYRVL